MEHRKLSAKKIPKFLWEYIFDLIRNFKGKVRFVLPNRQFR